GDPAARITFTTAAERALDRETFARAALGFAGRYAEAGVVDEPGIARLEEALARYGAEDAVLAVELRARVVDRLHFADQEQRAGELSAEALAMAQRLGDPRAQLIALESRHAALMHVDHLEERLRLSEELLALAARIGERELEAL